MGKVVRREEIRRRRTRKAKIKRLKEKIVKAGPSQLPTLIAKLKKVSPFYPIQKEK